jgi:5-formyltetrahydrofolate cyclo-ligase
MPKEWSTDEVKKQLRREARKVLAILSEREKAAWSQSIVDFILQDDGYRRSTQIGLYCAVEWEIDLMSLLERRGKESERSFAFPRWNPDTGSYEFARVRGRNQLHRGRFGVEEPAEECEFVPGHSLDMTFVPGVAFSRAGVRLGRGKGFYDRLLEGNTGQIVGVCSNSQLLDEIPAEEWDVPMARVITETGQIAFE